MTTPTQQPDTQPRTVEDHRRAVIAAIQAAEADGVRIDVAHARSGQLRLRVRVDQQFETIPATTPDTPNQEH